MIHIAVVGYGYWGPNLVRNFQESERSRVTMVCDMNEARLGSVASRYPTIQTTKDVHDIWTSTEVDAVAIATPVSTHFDIAMQALRAGKHVLVEKPMTDASDTCRRLIDEAGKRQKTLMVDHTFPYTGAVRKIKELVSTGHLGEIYYYDSVRVNLGLFQHDVSVIWDLAVHDLSIIDAIMEDRPGAVSATGVSHMKGRPENIAYLTLFFSGNCIAHIHVNWLAPVKVRQTLIGGSLKMIVYDDVEPTEKVKVYDKGVTLGADQDSIVEMRIGYRTGDMWAPKVDGTEALKLMTREFVDCIDSGRTPLTCAESGLRVVRIMEAATESLVRHGAQVSL